MILTQTSTHTDEQDNDHYHICYYDETQRIGEVAERDGHTHAVTFVEVTYLNGQPVGPEELQQILQGVEPEQQPQILQLIEKRIEPRLLPSEEDGHTHEILPEYQPTDDVYSIKESDDEVFAEFVAQYNHIKNHNDNFHRRFRESEEFYVGIQWDSFKKQALEAENRAALTVNYTESNLDRLCDFQREQRTDIKYYPVSGGDQKKADIYNIISKILLRKTDYAHRESRFFLDACIGGRGSLTSRMDYTYNIEGDLKIDFVHHDEILTDSYRDPMLEDCSVIFKQKWVSFYELQKRYPDYADEMMQFWDLATRPEGLTNDSHKMLTEDYPITNAEVYSQAIKLFLDQKDKTSLIVQRQMRYFVYAPALINKNFDFVIEGLGWRKKDVDDVRNLTGFDVINRNKPVIRTTTIAGGVLIDDDPKSDMPYDEFNTIVMHNKIINNYIYGKIEPVKDLQREINKRHSQITDIANFSFIPGFFIEPDMFPSPEDAEDFKENANIPNAVHTVNDVNRTPVRKEGGNFPSDIVNLLQLDEATMSKLMNVEFGEIPSNDIMKLAYSIKQSVIGNGHLFDNLRRAKQKLGRHILWYIQNYYTPQRIIRMLKDEQLRGENVNVQGQLIDQYPEEEIISILQDDDISKYDVEVSEGLHSPTIKMATAYMLMELYKQSGGQIPFDAIVENWDLPEESKNKIKEQAAAQAEGQAEEQRQTMIMEVAKSAGIVPPDIAAQFIQQSAELENGENPILPRGSTARLQKQLTGITSPNL